jgi:hypothetical protein
MSNDQIATIIDRLAAAPRSTAQELGTTTTELDKLVARGLIQRFGTRKTGKRGKPPVEYIVAGADVSDTQAEAVDEAKAKVAEYFAWDRSSSKLWRMREELGYNAAQESDAYMSAYCAHYDRWPQGTVPAIPTQNEMLMAGAAEADVAEDGTLVAA